MKLHTNTESAVQTLTEALRAAQQAGRIAPHVRFDNLVPARSRSHSSAADFHMIATHKATGEKRFRPGFGRSNPDSYAATYDEYGWLMVAIFDIDPSASFGKSIYADAADFHAKTRYQFDTDLTSDDFRADTARDRMREEFYASLR